MPLYRHLQADFLFPVTQFPLFIQVRVSLRRYTLYMKFTEEDYIWMGNSVMS